MSLTGKTISHYKILSQLGEGGMGIVYRALDTKLDRDVALKFLPPEVSRDDEANARFTQEARAASALNHPNVCSIYDIKETDDGRLFIVMPFYDGETLKYRVEDGSLDRDQALSVARQVADGLAAAHKKDIVHRDIKPANIMVTDDGHAVILDFGLAKLTGGLELTRTGSTIGTAYYMSPEQIRGEAIDHRSDVWSLGVVLYQMLTGNRPFQGDYEQAISYAILNHHPENDLDPDTAQIVARCLKKATNERFQSAKDVSDALNELGSTSGTRCVSPEKRSRGRSHKTIGVGAGAVTAILLAIFFAFKSGGEAPGGSVPDPTRLVVLPFDNLGSPDDDYFADGMTEEITMRLASLSGMAVISQNTATHYRNTEKTIGEIGSELDVNYVLGGSVRWDKRPGGEETVRITPRLIRVSDDTNVWTETYERTIEGVFAIQSEVAENVANELNVTLLDREIAEISKPPTDNIEAYQAYLQGVAISRDNTLGRAQAAPSLELAVRLDPDFADAYFHLGEVYAVSAWVGTPEDWSRLQPLADKSAAKLRELSPGSAQDHILTGLRAYYFDLDFKRARTEFRIASEMEPENGNAMESLAWIHRRLGEHDKAADIVDAVLKRDPQNFTLISEAFWTHTVLSRHERAVELIDQAIQLQPTNTRLHCSKAWNVLRWRGDIGGARRIEASAPSTEALGPCWWSDLAERKFEDILVKQEDVNPMSMGDHWYGVLFHSEAQHFYFRRAYSARRVGNVELERASWQALLALVAEHGPGAYEATRFRNNQAVSVLGYSMANAGLGNIAETRSQLLSLRQGIAHDMHLQATMRSQIAFAYTLIGDFDEAIPLLEEDFETTGLMTGPWLEMPFWDELRDYPRFQNLVMRYGR